MDINNKKQPKWNKYETILLMDTFINIEKGMKKRQIAILELSNCLRDYAINNGLKINEKYRNLSGISMKLENIRYIYTNGQCGLAGYSKIEKEIVSLYLEKPTAFKDMLLYAKQIYNNEI